MNTRALLFAGAVTATLAGLLGTALPLSERVTNTAAAQQRAVDVLYVQLAPTAEDRASWRAQGRHDAIRDFKAGQLVLLTFGLTIPDDDLDQRVAALGIRVRPMGCDVSEARLIYGEGYAEAMKPLIESRLGRHVWSQLRTTDQ